MGLLDIIGLIIQAIDVYLVPLVFALAFIMFLFGIWRGFIANNSGKAESIKEARSFAIWGIIGMAIMVSVWGLVRIVDQTIPFDSKTRPDIPLFQQQTTSTAGGSGSNVLKGLQGGATSGTGSTGSLPSTVGASCSQSAGCGGGLQCYQDNTCHPFGDIAVPASNNSQPSPAAAGKTCIGSACGSQI